MTIADKAVLVTGANRGIGQALVQEALRRGAKRVYAGTRQPLAHVDGRITPLALDVTSAAQIQAAVERVGSLDLLINNAGLGFPDDLSDRAALEQHLAVNLLGTYGVTQAFLPLLTRSQGAIANVLSLAAFAAVPVLPAYSISKAAAFNLTQSLRALLAGRGVSVHAVLAGPVDTDMARGLDHTEGLAGVGCARHLRRPGERGGGDLSRSHGGAHGGGLAPRCGQGARTRECRAPASGERRGMSTSSKSQVSPVETLTTATAAALTATLGLAAACWVVAVHEMHGMDMGVATPLGSVAFFAVLWVSMMAAMMLPGAAPAVVRRAHGSGGVCAVPRFVGSYLAVWALVGIPVYVLYRPHGSFAAGAVAIAAGVYELTPLKQRFRRRCRESVRSGIGFGLCCVGSSIGLMLVLVALSVMSIAWMSVIAAVALAQKLLPANAAIDVPLALAIVGLGLLILIAPASVPGLMPPM
jgi:NAD(P)-dependent dehydrogenase (short-subunit alcohol dehydrogenase family)/predicted metal-binding membrane protein